MRLPDRLARFNRYVTNPIQLLWAGRLPGFGIVQHTGRRSGRAYRTPVNAYRLPDGFSVLLPYGPDRDWVQNLRAAGKGSIVHRGRTYEVTNPTVLPTSEGLKLLPQGPAAVATRLKIEYVLHLSTRS
ncbi:MAG: nitroreductase family deazaflavin-dependent oxidoreductase [Sciscionella sp.]